jgi:RNA polymerase sigma factor (sigma-70 family)
MIKFEERYDIIATEIAKRRPRWQLSSLAHMDFDDVSQILLTHIYKQWDLWDQSRPLVNWLNTVISNHMCNIIRNVYGNSAPPCRKCKLNLGGDLCDFTKSGIQCSECPAYAKWEKSKKNSHALKMATSLDDPNFVHSQLPEASLTSLDEASERLHEKIVKHLTKTQAKIYDMLYIQNLSEKEVAEKMGYKTTESNRAAGYKQIHNVKKVILETAKKVLETEDVFYG